MKKKLLLALGLAFVTTFALSSAHATPLPVGTYNLSLQTSTSGIHSGSDEGTLSGTLTFDAASNLVFADLAFDDTTTGTTFSFTNPGATTIDPGNFLSATLYNATDPATFYAFSIRIPSSTDSFQLTCGTDCHTWMDLDQGGSSPVYVELNFGSLTPAVPEPSTFLLFGTGLCSGFAALRNRTCRIRNSA